VSTDARISKLPATDPVPAAVLADLERDGFVILREHIDRARARQLVAEYDLAVERADPADVSRKSSTRVWDFVHRGPAFDPLWLDPVLLELVARQLPCPFKLSTFHARAVNPGAIAQDLHVDQAHEAGARRLIGFIWMLDEFTADNGATRFIRGSHRTEPDAEPELALGPPGSLIVYDGAIWHGFSANRTDRPRRSLQGAFCWRTATSWFDHQSRLRADTCARLGELGRHVLGID
jgi:hypothetical protein